MVFKVLLAIVPYVPVDKAWIYAELRLRDHVLAQYRKNALMKGTSIARETASV